MLPFKESTHGEVHFDIVCAIFCDISWNSPTNFGALNKQPPL